MSGRQAAVSCTQNINKISIYQPPNARRIRYTHDSVESQKQFSATYDNVTSTVKRQQCVQYSMAYLLNFLLEHR